MVAYEGASRGPTHTDKKKRRKNEQTLGSYVYKVHKQVHSNLGISSKAIMQINGVLNEVLSRMTTKGAEVARVGKKSTFSARHVQAATQLIMPFELSKLRALSAI